MYLIKGFSKIKVDGISTEAIVHEVSKVIQSKYVSKLVRQDLLLRKPCFNEVIFI